jgi:pilus assembly protein CpaB
MKLPALKLPNVNRNFLMLGGAIALGIVATILSYKLLQDRMAQLEADANNNRKLVPVVVAKMPIPAGTTVQKNLFAVRQIPAEFVNGSSIPLAQFDSLVGQKMAAPLQGGEPLLTVHLAPANVAFSTTLANGNRALTTEVDEINSISGMLRPTDRIDLMATARGSGTSSAEVTFALLTNVEVLATGQATRPSDDAGGDGRERTYNTITLSVSPTDAQRIVVAKGSGKLTAVLRNPEDANANLLPAMNIDDVLPHKPVVKKVAVQYIIG